MLCKATEADLEQMVAFRRKNVWRNPPGCFGLAFVELWGWIIS